MRRDALLIAEMIEAAEQAQLLVLGIDLEKLGEDRQRRDALLWNFAILGEAAVQLDATVKERFPTVDWVHPTRLRNRVVHGYWSIDLEILHTTATDLLPSYVGELRAALEALEAEESAEVGNHLDPESDEHESL